MKMGFAMVQKIVVSMMRKNHEIHVNEHKSMLCNIIHESKIYLWVQITINRFYCHEQIILRIMDSATLEFSNTLLQCILGLFILNS